MKTAMKIAMITAIGLITAIVLYPFMHESGHVLATLGCGGSVSKYMLFPLPNVLTDISGVSKIGLTVIGMSGILFPFFISVVVYPKHFAFWYSAFVLKGIVLLSSIISAAVVLLNHSGLANQNDDMIKVLQYGEINEYLLLVILAFIAVIMLFLLFRAHPIKRICLELNI